MRTSILGLLLLAACGGTDGGGTGDPSQPDAGMNMPGADGGTDPDAPTPSTQAIVFITSNFYDGDLQTAGAGTTGLDGADKLCQLHADAASLAGTYRAWLSATTVDATDRITGNGPWVNTRGEIVFANRAQLQTHPIATVGYDEYGEPLSPIVWTGTDVGRAAPPEYSSDDNATCNDWTSSSPVDPNALYGDSGQYSSSAWTRNGYDSCYKTHALYCLAVTN